MLSKANRPRARRRQCTMLYGNPGARGLTRFGCWARTFLRVCPVCRDLFLPRHKLLPLRTEPPLWKLANLAQ